MNKIFRLFMICLTATTVFACNDDDTTGNDVASAVLEISEEDKNLAYDIIGGCDTITIKINTTFTLESGSANWLKVSDIKSEAGITTFAVNVSRNAAVESREAKLVLKLKGAEDVEINVSQEGVPTLTASRRSIQFTSIENGTNVFVSANKFTATVSDGAAGWLTATVADTTLRIKATENFGNQPRSASITVHVDGYEDVTVDVSQEIYTEPALSLSVSKLDFEYMESEQTISVNTNRPIYTVSAVNAPWLSYEIAGAALKIKVVDSYDSLSRTATVVVHINGVDNKYDQYLTVTQNVAPDAMDGYEEVRADRTGWVAQVEGAFIPDWYGGRPNGLLDGDPMTGWHTARDNKLPQTLIIDMKKPQIVTKIQLEHQPEALANNWLYCKTIDVYLGQSYVTPTDEAMKWGKRVTQYTWSPEEGNPFTITLSSAILGRYLILYFPDSREGDYISLTEVNVYVKQKKTE
jgi:hypothetical protein